MMTGDFGTAVLCVGKSTNGFGYKILLFWGVHHEIHLFYFSHFTTACINDSSCI